MEAVTSIKSEKYFFQDLITQTSQLQQSSTTDSAQVRHSHVPEYAGCLHPSCEVRHWHRGEEKLCSLLSVSSAPASSQ